MSDEREREREREASGSADAELPEATRSWVCEHCSQTFRRAEHLQRHERRHLGHLPFHCPLCSRQFSRRDTLKRHLSTHQLSPEQTAALARSADSGLAKACTNCAKSKQKCDRETPCGRCRKRQLHCAVPSLHPDDELGVPSSSQTDSHQGGSSRSTPQIQLPGSGSGQGLNILAAAAGQEVLCRSGGRAFAPVAVPPSSINNLDVHAAREHEAQNSLIDYRAVPALGGEHVPQPDFAPILNATGPWFYPIPTWDYGIELDLDDFRAAPDPHYLRAPETYPGSGVFGGQETATAENTHTISLRPRYLPMGHVQSMVDDNDTLAAETHFHVPRFSDAVYESIQASFLVHRDRLALAVGNGLTFPGPGVLDTFVQLFFEPIHHHLPFLHMPTYNPGHESCILVLAVAAVGSQYSQISNQANLATSLRELLSEAILDRIGCNPRVVGDLAFGQAVFLSQLLLQCSGTLKSSLRSQYQKGILTAICRSVVSKNGSVFRTGKATSRLWRYAQDWIKWVDQESWSRLAFFSLLLEHMQSIIWDINPPIEVADIHRQLPESDLFWSCASSVEWEKERSRNPSQYDAVTFAELFTDEEAFRSYCENIEDPARLIIMSTVCSEEKRLRRDAKSWLHQRILRQHGIATTANHSCPAAAFPLDQEFQTVTEHLPELTPSTEVLHKTYHILSILRRVSQTELYLYFGWMTTPQIAQGARDKLAHWIQIERRSAKECLLHAASLFRLIRDQKTTAFNDPFCLLIATIFMRVLVDLDDSTLSKLDDQYPILRIDRNLGDDVRTSWLEGETHFRIYVAGVGLLDGVNSAPRIIKEAIRILNRDMGWKDLSSNVAETLGHVLQGAVPRTPDMPP